MLQSTGMSTKGGEEVHLGDILQGQSTHPMVVLTKPDSSDYFCYVISIKEENTIFGLKKTYTIENNSVFALEEMVSSWGDLKIMGSILVF